MKDELEATLQEMNVLRVKPDEVLIIRIDPSVELEAQGFHEGFMQALADAGLSGRALVISLPPTKVEFAVVEKEFNDA